MPNVDQQRKIREAAAYKRDEEHRAERRLIEQKERDRAKRELERRRYDEMAKAKQDAKKADELRAMDEKQERMMAELERKKAREDADSLAQQAQAHKAQQYAQYQQQNNDSPFFKAED
jgi:dTMP kinase